MNAAVLRMKIASNGERRRLLLRAKAVDESIARGLSARMTKYFGGKIRASSKCADVSSGRQKLESYGGTHTIYQVEVPGAPSFFCVFDDSIISQTANYLLQGSFATVPSTHELRRVDRLLSGELAIAISQSVNLAIMGAAPDEAPVTEIDKPKLIRCTQNALEIDIEDAHDVFVVNCYEIVSHENQNLGQITTFVPSSLLSAVDKGNQERPNQKNADWNAKAVKIANQASINLRAVVSRSECSIQKLCGLKVGDTIDLPCVIANEAALEVEGDPRAQPFACGIVAVSNGCRIFKIQKR